MLFGAPARAARYNAYGSMNFSYIEASDSIDLEKIAAREASIREQKIERQARRESRRISREAERRHSKSGRFFNAVTGGVFDMLSDYHSSARSTPVSSAAVSARSTPAASTHTSPRNSTIPKGMFHLKVVSIPEVDKSPLMVDIKKPLVTALSARATYVH